MEDQPFRVLIIATGDGGCRSQMLAGWLRWFGGKRLFVEVGADKPGERDPMAIRAMADIGLDIRGDRAAPFIKFLDDPWDVIVLMRDPQKHKKPKVTHTKQMIYYEFPNPKKPNKKQNRHKQLSDKEIKQEEENTMIQYRNVRDDIHDWARTFCEKTVGLVREDSRGDKSTLLDVSR